MDMILESYPWKQGLLRDAATLSEWRVRRSSARRSFIIEETVFIAAFKIRRLIESGKISSNLTTRSIPSAFYSCKSPVVERFGRFNLDELYDMTARKDINISISFLVNSLIHSFVFLESIRKRKSKRGRMVFRDVGGFIFNSDKDKKKGLWEVSLDDFIDILKLFGRDDPKKVILVWDERKEDWHSWIGSGPPPADILTRLNSKFGSPD